MMAGVEMRRRTWVGRLPGGMPRDIFSSYHDVVFAAGDGGRQ